MGPILDAIWQLPWYKALVVAVVDDVMFLIKLWPLWALVVLIGVLRILYLQWYYRKVKRARMKRWAEIKKSTNNWKDHGTYYKRPGRGEKR